MPPIKPVTQASKKAAALSPKAKAARAAALKKKNAGASNPLNTRNKMILDASAFVSTSTVSDEDIQALNDGAVAALRPEFAYAYGKLLRPREAQTFAGLPSLFNNYAVFRYYPVAGNTTAAFDREGSRGSVTPKMTKNPDAATIIQHAHEYSKVSSGIGAMPYAWADFLYCKYYGKIPNNYMVTLRRYSVPTLDNLQTGDGKPMFPIAQAVTWMSEVTGNKMSEFGKFSAGLKWKEIEASVQEVIGNERGHEAQPFRGNPFADAATGVHAFFNPNDFSGLTQSQEDYSREAWGADGPYANKVYGPVNVISKTLARDRGMEFKQDISLNFHYSAKSLGDINPRVAILDVFANIMSLTYNNAKFWGGAIRYFPQHPNYTFLGDQKKFYSGDMGGFIDSFATSLKNTGMNLLEQLKGLLSDPMGALKKLAVGGGTMWLGSKAAQSRPQILAIRSLLTGNPVGEWHLCVGNPMNPAMMIGNLICDGVEVTWGDEMGADDFPTELTATITLKHGKPRDKGDIESMFNFGNGRLYYGEFFDPAKQEKYHASANESNTNKVKPKNSRADGDNTSEAKISANQRSVRGSGMWGPQFRYQIEETSSTVTQFFD